MILDGFTFALGVLAALAVVGAAIVLLCWVAVKVRYTRVGWWAWRRWPTRRRP